MECTAPQPSTSSGAPSRNGNYSFLIQSNPRNQIPRLGPLGPGISKPIFEALRVKVEKMSESRDRLCVLLFTDSRLEPHVDYSSHQDCLVGFEDNGFSRSEHPANTVSVFMLRSIFSYWKQPVGFVFTDSTMWHHQAAFFIKEIVKMAKEAGLEVVACICKPHHAPAVDYLLKESRKMAEERGKPIEDNTFIVGEQEVVAIFDPTTLFLAVRDTLLEQDIIYDGHEVKWKYIKEAYEMSVRHNFFPLTWELLAKQVNPAEIDRDNVTACVRSFSNTLGAFICKHAGSFGNGKLPSEAINTGRFILVMNRVFDSLNRGLVYKHSSQPRTWLDIKNIFSNKVKIPTGDNIIKLWIRTLDGLIAIRKNIFSLGYHSFFVTCFNLDPLENNLDIIRQSNLVYQKGKLTCKLFLYYYRKALSLECIYHFYPICTNRKCDDLKHLVQIEHSEKFVSSREEVDLLPVSFADVAVDYEDEMAVECVTRYLRKFISVSAREFVCAVSLRNLYGSDVVDVVNRIGVETFIRSDLTNRVKPDIIKTLIEVYSYINIFMNSHCHYPDISKQIVNRVSAFINFNFEICSHTSHLRDSLLNKFVRTVIRKRVSLIQKSVIFTSDDID